MKTPFLLLLRLLISAVFLAGPQAGAQDSFAVGGSESAPTKEPAATKETAKDDEKPQEKPKDNVSLAEHVNRGNNLMRARRYQEAMAEYKAAKALDPKNAIVRQNIAECYNNMGISLYRQRSFPDAIIQFEKCLQVLSSHPQARRNIALCRQIMDQEGIADAPSSDPDEAAEEKSKKPDPKASTAVKPADAPSMTISAGGRTYVSGSQLFPNYSNTPSAVSEPVMPTNPAVKQAPVQASPPVNPNQAHSAALFPGIVPPAPPAESVQKATGPVAGAAFEGGGTNPLSSAVNSSNVPAGAAANTGVANTAIANTANSTSGSNSSAGAGGGSSNAGANSAAADGLSLEHKVDAIELKLYGKKHSDMALKARLEQLEMDNFGQVRQGTTFERVENLRKAILAN